MPSASSPIGLSHIHRSAVDEYLRLTALIVLVTTSFQLSIVNVFLGDLPRLIKAGATNTPGVPKEYTISGGPAHAS